MATRAATLRLPGRRRAAAAARPGLVALAAACLALGALTLLAPTTPTYDPWAWLIWGREVLHLKLDTQFGPSWKPLPVALTTIFALVPGAAPALWVAVARAGALAAIALGFRVAWRLGGGVAGGLVAAVAIAVSTDFLRFAAVGDSEGVLVALLLVAVDLHLSQRRRGALWACFGAALLRPESWPFVGLYALWVAWREPPLRKVVAGMTLAGAAVWFGPELWGSGNALRAGERARDPNPNALAFAEHPAREVVRRFHSMLPLVAELGLAAAVIQAALRRRLGVTGVLAVASLAWLGVVAVMTEAGFSGNARYLIAPVSLACVSGGAVLGQLLTRAARRPAVAIALAAAALVPAIAVRADDLSRDGRAVRNEARLMDDLTRAVDASGGAASILRCGDVTTGPFQVTALAWRLDAPIRRVGLHPRAPGTLFRAGPRPRSIPGAPPLATPDRRWKAIARTEAWQVLSTCI